jgi:hypothetical protein
LGSHAITPLMAKISSWSMLYELPDIRFLTIPKTKKQLGEKSGM